MKRGSKVKSLVTGMVGKVTKVEDDTVVLSNGWHCARRYATVRWSDGTTTQIEVR